MLGHGRWHAHLRARRLGQPARGAARQHRGLLDRAGVDDRRLGHGRLSWGRRTRRPGDPLWLLALRQDGFGLLDRGAGASREELVGREVEGEVREHDQVDTAL